MWELDYKKTWAPKNWCFWTVVLEKTLESPWDCKEIQPVHPKGNQSWLFIGRTDAKAEIPILWAPHAKNWLIWKDLDAEKDWRQEEKGTTKDKMVGWYHRLNGHEWVNSRSWWWTGRPGILQSMGSQRVPHAWVTELNWTELGQTYLLVLESLLERLEAVTHSGDIQLRESGNGHIDSLASTPHLVLPSSLRYTRWCWDSSQTT